MWIICMYTILTMINIGVIRKPYIYERVSNFFIITRLFGGNWKLVLVMYIISIKLMIKQWWKKTCKRVDINVYELHHIINGNEVKVLISIVDTPAVKVLNNSGDDVTDKTLPYLRHSMVSLKPRFVGEKGLTICKK